MSKNVLAGLLGIFSVAAFHSSAMAATCFGNCGTLAADGDVSLSPTGNASYGYISTYLGEAGSTAGEIDGVGDNASGFVTGSQFTTDAFSGTAGDSLTFYFNYVTSDGAGFADYAWAELLDDTMSHVAWLFTARTVEAPGDTSPGFGLPANDATLMPSESPIIPGAPSWSALGNSTGTCFADGCGSTGWIQSVYELANDGDYYISFGVTNWSDSNFQSGLAFDGLMIGDVPIGGPVPEASTWAMLILGLGFAGAALRRRSSSVGVSYA